MDSSGKAPDPEGGRTLKLPAEPPLSQVNPTLTLQGASKGGPPGSPASQKIGPYRIISTVAQGGMGIVYRVHDSKLGRDIALKMLIGGAWADPETQKRFLREAHLMAELTHPGIVPVHDMGVVDGAPYYTMDLVEGKRLDEYARDQNLPLADRLRLFCQVCEAVHHAHRKGVIHRDLKPGNILTTPEGVPMILDFGIAHLAQPGGLREALTMSGVVMGTPLYMAPEQAQGHASKIDVRTDVYSLGVILYELVTGKLPYEGTETFALLKSVIEEEPRRPSTWAKGLAPDLEAIILKAIAKEQDRRYESAHALSEDLRRYLDGKPVAAVPDTAVYRLRKWTRRHKELSAAIAVAGVLLATAVWRIYRTGVERGEALEQARMANEGIRRAMAETETRVRIYRQLATSRSLTHEENLKVCDDLLREKLPEWLEIDVLEHKAGILSDASSWWDNLAGDAASLYQKILERDPGRFSARTSLGDLLIIMAHNAGSAKQPELASRLYEEALAQFREADRLRPGLAKIQDRIAEILATVGGEKEALDPSLKAYTLDPVHGAAGMKILVNKRMSRGSQDGALALLERMFEIHPEDQVQLFMIAQQIASRGKPGDALLGFLRKLDKARIGDQYLSLESDLLVGLGRCEEAVSVLREYMAKHPGRNHLHVPLGRVYERLGRSEDAAQAYTEALRGKLPERDSGFCRERLEELRGR